MEENRDAQDETPRNRKNSLGRLKDRLKAIDKLINDHKTKSGKREDLCIQASEIERLLWQADREDKASEPLAQLSSATEQLTRANAEIARLTQANAELRASQTPRVNAKALEALEVLSRIPDSALQEQVDTLAELLKSVATLARGVDVDARTRHAVSLAIKYGRSAMSVVEGLGVDYASVLTSLNRSETELLTLLQSAEREGTATPIWRAVLALKYQVQVNGHGKRQSPYRDEFSDDSSLYADSL